MTHPVAQAAHKAFFHHNPCSFVPDIFRASSQFSFANTQQKRKAWPVISPRSLTSIRLFYAAYFAAMGLILPYFPVYLTDLGLNTFQVGIFVGILSATKIISPPLAGLLLEQQQTNTRKFLLLISMIATITVSGLLLDFNFWLLLTTITLFGLCWAAILPLTDGLSLIVSEISMMTYGRLRVWGSVGFVLASFAGGIILVGENIHFFPWMLTTLLLFTTIAAIGFPDLTQATIQATTIPRENHTNPSALAWLLFIGFCMQASHGAYYGFFSLYMIDAGYSGGEIGAFWVLGVVAEIVLMWYWSKSIQSLSPVIVFSVCLSLAAIRWLGTALTTDMLAILFLQLLHAASFAAFHLSAVAWVRRFSKTHRQTSGQGWYSSLGFGLGSAVGIMLCGWIVEQSSFSDAFFACTLLALLGLLAVAGLHQQMKRQAPTTSGESHES